MGRNKINNIFDWLNEISYVKSPSNSFTNYDWEKWNSYMIHRFISMYPPYIELVNEVQILPPQEKEKIYNIYREFLPKKKVFFKYIKKKKNKYGDELLKLLSQYFKVSTSEIEDYLNILSNNEIFNILENLGKDKKEIKKLFK